MHFLLFDFGFGYSYSPGETRKTVKTLRLNAFRPPLGAYDAPNMGGKGGENEEKSPESYTFRGKK